MNNKPAMLWVDLETTGLASDKPWSAILEAGFVLTDGFGNTLEKYSVVPEYPENFLSYVIENLDEVCTDMHTKSSLLTDLRTCQWKPLRNRLARSREDWAEAAKRLSMHTAAQKVHFYFLDRGYSIKSIGLPMAGATVHFDRRWLFQYWPEIENGFHYRNMDISSIRECVKALRPDLLKVEPETQNIHRAIPDIEDAIQYYKWAQEHFFMKLGGTDGGAN